MNESEKAKIKALLFDQLKLIRQESAARKAQLPELSEAMVKIISVLLLLD